MSASKLAEQWLQCILKMLGKEEPPRGASTMFAKSIWAHNGYVDDQFDKGGQCTLNNCPNVAVMRVTFTQKRHIHVAERVAYDCPTTIGISPVCRECYEFLQKHDFTLYSQEQVTEYDRMVTMDDQSANSY